VELRLPGGVLLEKLLGRADGAPPFGLVLLELDDHLALPDLRVRKVVQARQPLFVELAGALGPVAGQSELLLLQRRQALEGGLTVAEAPELLRRRTTLALVTAPRVREAGVGAPDLGLEGALLGRPVAEVGRTDREEGRPLRDGASFCNVYLGDGASARGANRVGPADRHEDERGRDRLGELHEDREKSDGAEEGDDEPGEAARGEGGRLGGEEGGLGFEGVVRRVHRQRPSCWLQR
jgi:hypothetical protein